MTAFVYVAALLMRRNLPAFYHVSVRRLIAQIEALDGSILLSD